MLETTYGRMLDKSVKPTPQAIENYLGAEAFQRLGALEAFLTSQYDLRKELRFPFGNHYGWGYKYSHRTKHLCYAFFENGAFTVTLQIGAQEAPKVQAKLDAYLPKTQELWRKRYPCGDGGGWVHYRPVSDAELADVEKLIMMKRPPTKGGRDS